MSTDSYGELQAAAQEATDRTEAAQQDESEFDDHADVRACRATLRTSARARPPGVARAAERIRQPRGVSSPATSSTVTALGTATTWCTSWNSDRTRATVARADDVAPGSGSSSVHRGVVVDLAHIAAWFEGEVVLWIGEPEAAARVVASGFGDDL
jgi:hypothetical protein